MRNAALLWGGDFIGYKTSDYAMRALNLGIVLVVWIANTALYSISYRLGLAALFFLSILHVFMKFPLNYQSIIGIGRILWEKLANPPDRIMARGNLG